MRHFLMKTVGFSLLFILLFALGCGKEVIAPPEPLSVDQLPAVMGKAFSAAKPAAKDLATQIISSVQAQDYSKAFLDIQSLSTSPGLTKEQSSVAARALMTINELMKSAVAKGDAKSAATLQHYRMTK